MHKQQPLVSLLGVLTSLIPSTEKAAFVLYRDRWEYKFYDSEYTNY